MRQSDDETARLLLEILAEEPPPPSRVDVTTLVRVGRQKARFRRLVGIGGAAVVTVGALAVVPVAVDVATRERPAPVPVQAMTGGAAEPARTAPTTDGSTDRRAEPTSCQPIELPVPANTVRSTVLGGDPSGRYLVGTATDQRRRSQVLRWDEGRLEVLDLPVVDPVHLVVNSRGDVAGDARSMKGPAEQVVPWLYRDGKFFLLPHSGATTVSVAGINERGDVLGLLRTFGMFAVPRVPESKSEPRGNPLPPALPDPLTTRNSSDVPGKRPPMLQPVIWSGEWEGTARLLDVPDKLTVLAVQGIDDDGTVVGTGEPVEPSRGDRSEGPPSRGMVWAPDGTVRELSAPAGAGPGTIARSIRGGWVVGSYQSATEPAVGARWNLRTGEVRPAALKYVTSVNRAGWVAGYVLDGTSGQAPTVVFGERMLTLPMPAGYGRSQGDPITVTISDDGRQIGAALWRKEPAAFRWTCG
ncbi:hypothetical protein ACI2K4_12390 [Micromonospora sp. NPDC050397]|uniref:hypothetical protein n=1 Tax=Micromonospora sp. NPDC050397 TaxID=3364279 RepID=UPI00384EF166